MLPIKLDFEKKCKKMFNLKKVNFWITLTPFLLSLAMVVFILISGRFLPPKLPLFYSLSWGEKQLAGHQQLLIIPSSIILVTLCNLTASWQLHPQQLIFKKILLFSSVLVSLILTITFLKIILIFI